MNPGKLSSSVRALMSIALLFSGAYSQPRQQKQEETLKLKSELIQFDVLVTDKNDHSVTGLTKDDFVLSDGGKPQDISFFSFVDVAAETQKLTAQPGANSTPPALIDTSSGRTIFIILDSFFISRTSYPYLDKALARLIDEDLLPGDQVAIINTNGALAGFQQATKNKKVLLAAIHAFVGNTDSLANMDPGLIGNQQDFGPSRASRPNAQYIEQKRRDTLRVLMAVLKATSDVPGRKIAFFISEDFSMRLRGPFENLFTELEEVIYNSRQGGMTFYTMDPRGLVAGGGSGLLMAQEGLRDLAAGTGGYAILNNNDLHAGLQRVMSQNSSYYVLAYYPADLPGKQQFRKVKVQVKNRPELSVYSRTGYQWTGSSQGVQKLAELPKQQRVSNALAAVVPIHDLKVNIPQVIAVKDEKTGEPVAEMEISIDPNSWPFKVEGTDHLASFEVIGFAYDLTNKLVDGFDQGYNVRLTPDNFARAMKEGMNLPGKIKLKKRGLYSLKVVVIDKETNRLGSATEWVQAQ
jgi:VWFA-related protein